METRSPFARGPVRIFVGALVMAWFSLIGAHIYGFRFFKPNLERAEDRQAYGATYTHK